MSNQFKQKSLNILNFLLNVIVALVYFGFIYLLLVCLFTLLSYFVDYSLLSNPFINTVLPTFIFVLSSISLYKSSYTEIINPLFKENISALKSLLSSVIIFSIFLISTGSYNLLHLSFIATKEQYKITYTNYPVSSEQYRDLKVIVETDNVLALRSLNIMKYTPAELDNISALINFFNRNENSKLLTIRQEYIELVKKPYVSRYDITEFRHKLISVLKSDIQLFTLMSQL